MLQQVLTWFDFSRSQFRALVLLTATALVLTGFLVIRSYSTPTADAASLPVLLGDDVSTYVGTFVLDPNTAPQDSLELLPGIGPVLAERIVAYRNTHTFEHASDMMAVDGVGPRTYERFRHYVRIAPR